MFGGLKEKEVEEEILVGDSGVVNAAQSESGRWVNCCDFPRIEGATWSRNPGSFFDISTA